jgi:hypothetical protein
VYLKIKMMESQTVNQTIPKKFKETTSFKNAKPKLIPCRFFPEFLNEGVFLVIPSDNRIFRIKEKRPFNYVIESDDSTIMVVKDPDQYDMHLLFLTDCNMKDIDPDFLFNIGGDWTIAGPLDLLGDQIEEAISIAVNPDQIGWKIKKYGDYREWESLEEFGLKAHQAYYWVDRIMVLDESIMREDGNPHRKYVTEYTSKEFSESNKGWKEILNPIDFEDIRKIISGSIVQIETSEVFIEEKDDGGVYFLVEHPRISEKKCFICIDEN